jgi:hypothetical protein
VDKKFATSAANVHLLGNPVATGTGAENIKESDFVNV